MDVLAEVTDPTAAIYGCLATAIVGGVALAIRFIPRVIKNGKGERLVTREHFEEFKKECEKEFEKEHKYTHDFVHDVRGNFMQTQTLKVALLEQQVKNLEGRLEDSSLLGDKIDELRTENAAASNRQCQLLEAALKRTYKHDG